MIIFIYTQATLLLKLYFIGVLLEYEQFNGIIMKSVLTFFILYMNVFNGDLFRFIKLNKTVQTNMHICLSLDWRNISFKNNYNWWSFKSVYCSFIWYFSCITGIHFISLLTVIIIHYYLLSYFICNNKIKVVYTIFSCPFLIDVFLIWYLWLMDRSTNMNLSSK